MKEQVIASRGPRRSSGQQKGFVQKPARRDGSSPGRAHNFSPRALFGYLPAALKFMLAILILTGFIVGYRVAASAALFQARLIDVTGASRTSAEEIQLLTRRAVARTGVWRADLSAISAELSRLPGVRRAVVTRVLPDRIRVRITERSPVAVIRTSSGHFVWVDEEGVTLGEMKPEDRMPEFFIRGWNEEAGEDERAENVERVKKYLELVREWDAAGLSARVSEVTLNDLRDVRAQLAGDDSQVEVRLGSQDPGPRLQIALQALDTYKQTPRGASITYVDLQTGRVVIGFSSGSKAAAGSVSSNAAPAATDDDAPRPVTGDNNSTSGEAAGNSRPNEAAGRNVFGQQGAALRFR
jgi:cell division septal protein FtsQ